MVLLRTLCRLAMQKFGVNTLLCVKTGFIALLIGVLGSFYAKKVNGFNPPGDAKVVKFIPNKGQWHDSVRFKARIPGGQLFIGSNTLTYQFWDQKQLSDYHHKRDEPGKLKTHVLKMNLVNASSKAETPIETKSPTKTRYNFYQGKRGKWVSGLKAYREITLKSVYPGIDLVLKGQDQGIKYDFVLEPGAKPEDIEIKWLGADSVLKAKKKLKVLTSLEPLIEEEPMAYQRLKGKGKRKVPCEFNVANKKVNFDFPAGYPDSQTLVIDPNVIFATFSGSKADNFGFTGTFDSLGQAYSAGTVYGTGFPTRVGGYEVKFQGGERVSPEIGDIERDAGILKYSKDGSQLLYATYLGGSKNEQPHSMIVNHKAELIVYGTTYSFDFPLSNNAYDGNNNGQADIFLTKFSPDGTQLRASTFVGGSNDDGLNGKYLGGIQKYRNKSPLGYNYGDLYRGEVIVDDQNNVYVASSTRSRDFPTSSNALHNNYLGGYQDGCVFKISGDLSTLEWGTFIGGGNHDAAYSLKLNDQGQVYTVGGTTSPNFAELSDYQSQFQGGKGDGFILKLGRKGEKALSGTYWGTGSFDQNYFVELDPDGDVYVTGQSEGDMPIKNVKILNPNSGQFISKFSRDLSKLLYSTVFGDGRGHPDIAPSAFLVDVCENVYVSGWGGRTNRSSRSEGTSTDGLPVTPNAYQKQTDGSDFYLTVFRKGMDSLLYASFFGGSKSDEHVDGGTSRFDEKGMVYQSVCGGCHGNSDFPVTENAWSKTNNSNRGCNNAFFKIKLDVANAPPDVKDKVIKATATDTIRYPLKVRDPNQDDSVFLDYSGDITDTSEINGPEAQVLNTRGVKAFNANFRWPTICDYAGEDTFRVKLDLRDKGCPNPKSREQTLKIVVEKPPVFDPPEIFCSQVVDSHTIRLRWNEFKKDPYLKHFLLIRENPDGSKKILDSFAKNQSQTYTDNNAYNIHTTKYCYYLRSVNVCGKKGPSSYEICTGPDYKNVPDERELYTATVKNDQSIRVKWEKATEPDFDKYLVYRKKAGSNNSYRLYKKIAKREKTRFTDKKVKVNEQSYCYKLRVKDVCGFYSRFSNKGCTIVLKGKSEPFEHSLNWNPYKKWFSGVDHYTIYRKDPLVDTQFKAIAEVKGQKVNYLDDDLNYDVGAYWYKVKAHRNPGKPSEDNKRVSQSNVIYLEQAPLIHVPNAFSINRDGVNEEWGVKPVFVKTIHIQVYNRWGAKVFETTDKHERWRGPERHNYEEKFDNVFIYKITYTGWDESFHSTHGDLTILK